ncbi:MAG: glycosyltransferase [Actinomycetota bacterium]
MIEILFLSSIAVLWTFVLWHLFLSVHGVRFALARARNPQPLVPDNELPSVTVIVPAHNEARVIARSLQRLRALDYPAGKLEIVVVDDASIDRTGSICDEVAATDPRVRVVHVRPDEGGRGKSAALNRAVCVCRTPYIAVYDADTRPHPDAVRRLAGALVRATPGVYAAAIGHVAKANRRATLLNRFSAFEFAAYQWSVQAARAKLFDLVMITGTNFVIERAALERAGGWDPNALTEDLEVSIRLYGIGKRVLFVPEAASEEQDPQHVRAWIRQRVRWTLGNLYALRMHLRWLFVPPNARTWHALAGLTAGYTAFVAALAASDAIFIAGLTGSVHLDLPGPYLALWIAAIGVFIATFQVSQALEGEPTWRTPFVAALMYVSYTQLWLYVLAKSFARALFTRNQLVWVSTPRSHD